MNESNKDHEKYMLRTMKYCIDTPERGWELKPARQWNGQNKDFEFEVSGRADSDYANCLETRRSVSGYCVRLEDAPVAGKENDSNIFTKNVEKKLFLKHIQKYVGTDKYMTDYLKSKEEC
jgi:hypothetical protein